MSTFSSSTDSATGASGVSGNPAGTAVVAADAVRERNGLISVYMDLTKARLSALVVLTTAVGFIVASPVGIEWTTLLWTVLGTALAAGSASAFNQLAEHRRDSLMHRTRTRPLPAGAIGRMHAFVAAVLMGYLGIAILAIFANLFAAVLALLTILIYVLLYTPLKARSTTNTIVGAVCGAIPPMIGWAAATGSLATGAWVLGAILFVWQLPHFLALAWIYRDDYARGGFVMLPNVDPRGILTAEVTLLTSLMLLPLGLIAMLIGLAGWFYAVGSVMLAMWMTYLSWRFLCQRSDANARKVFIASIVYLSVLLMLFMLDRAPVRNGYQLSGISYRLTTVGDQMSTPNADGRQPTALMQPIADSR
jgi:heme o synthase